MSSLMILSPLTGWAAPLDEVPDPVFAGRMMGEGVAVDPTDTTLAAPIAGEVVSVAPTAHAVAIRAASGVEVLVHIGLETVALGGRGFELTVRRGQIVSAGEALGRFDLDVLAYGARSLISPVVIAEAAGHVVVEAITGREVKAGEPLLRLEGRGEALSDTIDRTADARRAEFVLALPHGLHARPAARVAQTAKAFAAEVTLETPKGSANAKSAVALMALGLGAAPEGVTLAVTARGPDAGKAVDRLRALLEGGLETGPEPGEAPSAPQPLGSPLDDMGGVRGVIGAPGVAIGPTFLFRRAELAVTRAGRGAAAEAAALSAARAEVRDALRNEASSAPTAALRGVLEAHLELLDDPDLDDAVRPRLARGDSAGFAWTAAVEAQADRLRGLDDPHLAARTDDLRDLGRRVLQALGGEAAATATPRDAIVLAEDLLPSEIIAMLGAVAGVCTAKGGPTSHVAILAAGAGLPLVVAAGGGVLDIADGTPAILDADGARLRLDPVQADLDAARRRLDRRATARAQALRTAADPCRLGDGTRVEVFANLGSVEDAVAAVAAGAEGCGLLRTEFLFLERDTAPDEDEQTAAYQAIADALDGRPLIVRTLDIGGDKPIPYLPLPAEANPALGLRGVRTSLWRPDLLATQLRAILRVRTTAPLRVMAPMVASPTELAAVRAVMDEARADLGRHDPIELGMMVETPAAAVTTALLAPMSDFFSIGTNDLTQYVLAMDRGNPATAPQLDALHPAVVRLIAQACAGAQAGGRWIGVCGGLASDPLAAPLLVGLGVRELSATPAAVPDVKARLRGLTLADCKRIAGEALDLASAADIRALLAGAVPVAEAVA